MQLIKTDLEKQYTQLGSKIYESDEKRYTKVYAVKVYTIVPT